MKDKVSKKILEIADGKLGAGELQKIVADDTNVSEVTVKRRISELVKIGILLQTRDGKNIYYYNSGLIEV